MGVVVLAVVGVLCLLLAGVFGVLLPICGPTASAGYAGLAYAAVAAAWGTALLLPAGAWTATTQGRCSGGG